MKNQSTKKARSLLAAAALGLLPGAGLVSANASNSRWNNTSVRNHAKVAVISGLEPTVDEPVDFDSVEEPESRGVFNAFGGRSSNDINEESRASEAVAYSMSQMTPITFSDTPSSATSSGDTVSNNSFSQFNSTSGSVSCATNNGQDNKSVRWDYYYSQTPSSLVCRVYGNDSSTQEIVGDPQACLAVINSCIAPAVSETPPTISDTNTNINNITSNSAVLNISVDKPGDLYWVVIQDGITPNSDEIINGQKLGGQPADFFGEHNFTGSDTSVTIPLNGLTSGGNYSVYLVSTVDDSPEVKSNVFDLGDFATLSIPSFNTATQVTNILTPYKTDDGYGGAREEVELEVDLSRASDIHYVILPTTDSAPTAAQVLTKAADTSITLSGVQQNISPSGKFTIDGLDRDTAYTLYSVATYPGDTALASGVQTTPLRLVTGTDKLLFDDWARMDDPEDDFVTFYDTTPTISGSANKDSILFAKLNGELLSGVESPKIPTSPLGNKQCVNLADRKSVV